MRKAGWVVSFAILLFTGIPSVAQAGLSVSPGIIEIIASRQDQYENVCKVTNKGTRPTLVTVEPEDWRGGANARSEDSVAHWLSVQPKSIQIAPGQTGEFRYKVKVALDAAGEYAAQIFFSETAAGGAAEVRARIGTVIYVAVRETIRLEAEISDCTVQEASSAGQSIITAGVSVRNLGNVHIRPTGTVEVYDSQGQIALALVLQTGWGILPGETYTYQGTGKGPRLKPGRYKAVAKVQYGKLFRQDKEYVKELFLQIGESGKAKGPQ